MKRFNVTGTCVDTEHYIVDISAKLKEYEEDHRTGMDISEIANEIYFHTDGYPFLVSRI